MNDAGGADATIAGGSRNTASGNYATVSGGYGNSASSSHTAVGGGEDNIASGYAATVPGGRSNQAAGAYSFAAGRRAMAQAEHNGAFVWADSSDFPFTSNRPNVFLARVTGGVRFVTGIDPDHDGAWTAGPWIDGGGHDWVASCDRALKENFKAVDGRDVLARVVALPITTWNGKAQSPDIRHMGPVAQDFYAAFGLGATDKGISTTDADGVALAAIQGLHSIVREREAQLADMAARLDKKDGEVAELRLRVEALEAQANSPAPRRADAPHAPDARWPLLGLGLIGGLVLWRRGKEA